MKTLSIMLVVFILSGLVVSISAQEDGDSVDRRDPEIEQEIYDRLAAIAPGAVPIFQQATEDMDAGSFEAARAGYRSATP